MAGLTVAEVVANISNMVSVKLEGSTNWTAWEPQFKTIITSVKIMDILDGSKSCPTQYHTSATGATSETDAYNQWVQHDLNLKTCIMSTISPNLVTEISHLTHAHEIWSLFLQKYTTINQTQSFQLRAQLNACTLKDYANVSEYLKAIKTLANQLKMAKDPMKPIDLVFIAMNGLPEEYDTFTTTIRNQNEPITFDTLESKLLIQEIHVNNRAKAAKQRQEEPLTAYQAQSNPNRGRGGWRGGRGRNNNGGRFSNGFSSGRFNNNTDFAEYNHGGGGHFNSGRTRGRNGGWRGGFKPQNYNDSYSTSSQSSNGRYCAYCDRNSHWTHTCWFKKDHPPHLAYTAASSTIADPSYYFDSGANNHTTRDLSHLQVHRPYYGPDSVTVGSGKELSIHNVGHGPSFEESSSQGPF